MNRKRTRGKESSPPPSCPRTLAVNLDRMVMTTTLAACSRCRWSRSSSKRVVTGDEADDQILESNTLLSTSTIDRAKMIMLRKPQICNDTLFRIIGQEGRRARPPAPRRLPQ